MLLKNEKEIEDRFYKTLTFGTGGIRGIMGAGTNRMNQYIIAIVTQGLAEYILEKGGKKAGVVIAFDSRHMSYEFSEMAALCLSAKGIRVYKFESLRPTPELSFAVRRLGCFAGIVITASHNPANYNGYKVYNKEGAQITDYIAKDISDRIKKKADLYQTKIINFDEVDKFRRYWRVIGKEIDEGYISELKKLILSPKSIGNQAKNIKIVYTPLHGTGGNLVKKILAQIGFSKVHIVLEQQLPDGDFPTVKSPNPEEPEAFTMALNLAKKEDAELVLATDPDADRLGLYVKDPNMSEYHAFTGNMLGILMAEYELSRKQELGLLPQNRNNGALVTTIVSTNMVNKLTQAYGVTLIKVLSGFKYIGEQINLFEEAIKLNNGLLDSSKGAYQFLYGFEESYGCLIGTYARDKDACMAAMKLCEMAAYYKDKRINLWEQMLQLYDKYGYYKETLYTVKFEGKKGEDKIQNIMSNLRGKQLKKIGKYKILYISDYNKQEIFEMETNRRTRINLPISNVLYYELSDEAWTCIRPSGTEAKVKVYIGVKGASLQDAEKQLENLKDSTLNLLYQDASF